jgi:hypothetical protein
MSEQSRALAENVCALFGKAYKRDGNPLMGGIEDKVLSDVIMLIDGMLRAHYGPLEAVQDALREAIADASANAEERDAWWKKCDNAQNRAITLRRQRDEALNLRDQYESRALAAEEGERIVTAERDALRAEVEAWRETDDVDTGASCSAFPWKDKARELRAQNEGGERG